MVANVLLRNTVSIPIDEWLVELLSRNNETLHSEKNCFLRLITVS